jgi:hypothetical protein
MVTGDNEMKERKYCPKCFKVMEMWDKPINDKYWCSNCCGSCDVTETLTRKEALKLRKGK